MLQGIIFTIAAFVHFIYRRVDIASTRAIVSVDQSFFTR